MTGPAGRLRQFLARHCSAATMERLVDPILTDTHNEAGTAATQGRHWASRQIRASRAISLFKALALYSWTEVWRIQDWQTEDHRARSYEA